MTIIELHFEFEWLFSDPSLASVHRALMLIHRVSLLTVGTTFRVEITLLYHPEGTTYCTPGVPLPRITGKYGEHTV